MKNRIKGIGFILIAIGTIGLLLNELAFNASTVLTLSFAGVDVIGLIFLAVSHYMKSEKTDS